MGAGDKEAWKWKRSLFPRAKGTIAINFWNNNFWDSFGENVMVSPTDPVGTVIPGSGLGFRPVGR